MICFDAAGKVTGEFGGYGVSAGWFFYPISMVIDSENRIWVAQVFQNLVQAFKLPEIVKSIIAEKIKSIDESQ